MIDVGLVQLARSAMQITRAIAPAYRSRSSDHDFSYSQLLAILCLAYCEGWSCEVAAARLASDDDLRSALDLSVAPDRAVLDEVRDKVDEAGLRLLANEAVQRLHEARARPFLVMHRAPPASACSADAPTVPRGAIAAAHLPSASQVALGSASAPPPGALPSEPGLNPALSHVPDRPVLAVNVKLLGRMKDNGFKAQQWLVQRDSQFVQLTGLLYRIAEHANGERTLAEIAHDVSAATRRGVSANNVRQLIATRLLPAGIITAPGATDADAGRAGIRSALAVNMRTKTIGPRAIERVARVLQYLFAPLVLIPMLVMVAAAQWWVFEIHSVNKALVQTLNTPDLVLVPFLLSIASAAFHEFGHASALRYGGGRARAIGAGLYLVYPVFFTDVTDSYRLGRWGRVRTDLGGVYFNLVFTVGVMVAYLVSHQEYLLVAVLWIDVDMLRQLLPFVRWDGYWLLADLTGIPDFFTLMGPFIQSLFPARRRTGPPLPALQGWVTIVFAVYALVTIPLLNILLISTAIVAPHLTTVAWQSLAHEWYTLIAAWSAGNGAGVVLSFLNLVMLSLTTFGLLFMLYLVGRRMSHALWRWSRPSTLRRAAGALVGIAMLGLLAYLWLPQFAALSALSTTSASPQQTTVTWTHVSTPPGGLAPLPSEQTPPILPTTTPVPSTATPATPLIAFQATGSSAADVIPGNLLTFSATVAAGRPLTVLVDFEVYGMDGHKVWQRWLDGEQLTGHPQTFRVAWAVPTQQASGRYSLNVGVFRPGWGVVYGWDTGAATFTITPIASKATPLPQPSPTPTQPSLTLTLTCATVVDYWTSHLCVHTQPGATLTITVSYCSGAGPTAQSSGLQGSVLADSAGNYTWTWTPRTTCRGGATAHVTASWKGHVVYALYDFTVH